MKQYAFIRFLFICSILVSCGEKISRISFKGNDYEVLYYHGNATSSDYIKIRKNGKTQYFDRVNNDSIESIIVNDRGLSVVFYHLNELDVTQSFRDTLTVK